MSTLPDRRSRKRLATREGISNVATRLFVERGFDKVTVDEIAENLNGGRSRSAVATVPGSKPIKVI